MIKQIMPRGGSLATPGDKIPDCTVTVVADRMWRCRPVAADRTGTGISSLLIKVTLNEGKHDFHINTELKPRVLRRPLELAPSCLVKWGSDSRMVNRHFLCRIG
jgi:hypothetical protein